MTRHNIRKGHVFYGGKYEVIEVVEVRNDWIIFTLPKTGYKSRFIVDYEELYDMIDSKYHGSTLFPNKVKEITIKSEGTEPFKLRRGDVFKICRNNYTISKKWIGAKVISIDLEKRNIWYVTGRGERSFINIDSNQIYPNEIDKEKIAQLKIENESKKFKHKVRIGDKFEVKRHKEVQVYDLREDKICWHSIDGGYYWVNTYEEFYNILVNKNKYSHLFPTIKSQRQLSLFR